MRRNPIRSGYLVSVGYESGILEIEFRDGSVYRYYNVPKKTCDELVSNEIPGRYYNNNVKVKGYRNADDNATDNEGKSPLHHVAWYIIAPLKSSVGGKNVFAPMNGAANGTLRAIVIVGDGFHRHVFSVVFQGEEEFIADGQVGRLAEYRASGERPVWSFRCDV